MQTGFANGYLDVAKVDPMSDWFDPSIIPVIPKLLSYDYNTLLNSMFLLNEAKDRKKFEDVTKEEAHYLVEKYFKPDFP